MVISRSLGQPSSTATPSPTKELVAPLPTMSKLTNHPIFPNITFSYVVTAVPQESDIYSTVSHHAVSTVSSAQNSVQTLSATNESGRLSSGPLATIAMNTSNTSSSQIKTSHGHPAQTGSTFLFPHIIPRAQFSDRSVTQEDQAHADFDLSRYYIRCSAANISGPCLPGLTVKLSIPARNARTTLSGLDPVILPIKTLTSRTHQIYPHQPFGISHPSIFRVSVITATSSVERMTLVGSNVATLLFMTSTRITSRMLV